MFRPERGWKKLLSVTITEEELEELIIKLAIEKEEDLTKMIKEKRSGEMLKNWLEKPARAEETDAVKEHNTVL